MGFDVFIVAGEASADLHAANLLKELKTFYPEINCFGVGSKLLKEQGVDIILPAEDLNVMGFSDWFDRVPEVWKGYRRVLKAIEERRPQLAILLDLPDFNLRLAKNLKAMGIPVVYYISPQVWAWRKYRIHQIKRDIDLMLVLFPFEKEFYDKHGVETHFVGHPLLESIQAKQVNRAQSLILKSPHIALLPGSRRSEVKFHAPILAETARQLRRRYPGAKFRIPVAPTLNTAFLEESFGSDVISLGIELLNEPTGNIMNWADVAIVASGTATLETALYQVPFALMYKVTRSSAWIFRNLIRYKSFIGMPNVLHNKEVVKEFFQEAASSDNLYTEIVRLMEDEAYRAEMISELSECRNKLGATGASLRAASRIHQLISSKAHPVVASLGHAKPAY